MAIMIIPAHAEKLQIGFDYENSFSLTGEKGIRKMNSLFDIFEEGSLSLDLKYIDQRATLNLGIADFQIPALRDANDLLKQNYYGGILAPNFNVFFTLGVTPIYKNYVANNALLKDFNVGIGGDRAFCLERAYTELIIPSINEVTGIYNNLPLFGNNSTRPGLFLGLNFKFGGFTFDGLYGNLDRYLSLTNIYNPYALLVDPSLLQYKTELLSLNAGYEFSKWIKLNLAYNHINSITSYGTVDLGHSSFKLSLSGATPILGGQYEMGVTTHMSISDTILAEDSTKIDPSGRSIFLNFSGIQFANSKTVFGLSLSANVGAELYKKVNYIEYASAVEKYGYSYPYYALGLTLVRDFEMKNSNLNVSFANKIYYANFEIETDPDRNIIIQNVSNFGIGLDFAFGLNLGLNVYNNYLNLNDNITPVQVNFEENIINLAATYDITKNVQLNASVNNYLNYVKTDDDKEFSDVLGFTLWGKAKLPIVFSDNAKITFSIAALGSYYTGFGEFKDELDINTDWNLYGRPSYPTMAKYQYDAYAAIQIELFKKFTLGVEAFAGDDFYTRNVAGTEKNLSIVASANLKYQILPQLSLSAVATYRNWKKDSVINSFINNVDIKDNFFEMVKIAYTPYKWVELSISWGRSGLVNDSVIEKANPADVKPWSHLSIIPTYGNMDYEALNFNIGIHF